MSSIIKRSDPLPRNRAILNSKDNPSSSSVPIEIATTALFAAIQHSPNESSSAFLSQFEKLMKCNEDLDFLNEKSQKCLRALADYIFQITGGSEANQPNKDVALDMRKHFFYLLEKHNDSQSFYSKQITYLLAGCNAAVDIEVERVSLYNDFKVLEGDDPKAWVHLFKLFCFSLRSKQILNRQDYPYVLLTKNEKLWPFWRDLSSTGFFTSGFEKTFDIPSLVAEMISYDLKICETFELVKNFLLAICESSSVTSLFSNDQYINHEIFFVIAPVAKYIKNAHELSVIAHTSYKVSEKPEDPLLRVGLPVVGCFLYLLSKFGLSSRGISKEKHKSGLSESINSKIDDYWGSFLSDFLNIRGNLLQKPLLSKNTSSSDFFEWQSFQLFARLVGSSIDTIQSSFPNSHFQFLGSLLLFTNDMDTCKELYRKYFELKLYTDTLESVFSEFCKEESLIKMYLIAWLSHSLNDSNFRKKNAESILETIARNKSISSVNNGNINKNVSYKARDEQKSEGSDEESKEQKTHSISQNNKPIDKFQNNVRSGENQQLFQFAVFALSSYSISSKQLKLLRLSSEDIGPMGKSFCFGRNFYGIQGRAVKQTVVKTKDS